MQRPYTVICHILICILLLFGGCRPEMPVTSTITVEAEGLTVDVNKELYGLTLEEINHAIEGGIYAELIRNRSFEEGVLPLHSRYDAYRNLLVTPNGWTMPFIRPDSVPGWYKLSSSTYFRADGGELLNDKSRRSLLVSVNASATTGRGGVAASGYEGIPLKKGERYTLTFYIKGGYITPRTISVGLEEPEESRAVSDVFTVAPEAGWKKYSHSFTAKEDISRAVLTFSTDTTFNFWLDVVSLMPENTWKERPNGLRPDLMETIAALQPAFIRFPGGAFVEGYTNGTFPLWKESIGNIADRRHFWNIWGYGSTNGMGYHEFLQMCEDLNAEPVYVVNSGVTNQNRRPRYEDITAMDRLIKDVLDAIAYANEPADSTWGAIRAANGHPEPFDLKYIEIGSENSGYEYARRFRLFKHAIEETYPEITIISSSPLLRQTRTDWTDHHFYGSDEFYITNFNRYQTRHSRRDPAIFIGEFGTATQGVQGTLRAAVAEACFYISAELNPDAVKRIAYAPVLGNTNFEWQKYPFILFDNQQIVCTPSYYVYQMFSRNRGDEVLRSEVDTYLKPQVTNGYAGIWMFDNSYEFRNVNLNGDPVRKGRIVSGGWKFVSGELIADPNRWNYTLLGDSTGYNYEFNISLRRTKGSAPVQLRVRDNGLPGDQNEHIGLVMGEGTLELYRQSGEVRDSLATPKEFPFESHQWYDVRISCNDNHVSCYVNGVLMEQVTLSPIPSITAVATWEEENRTILLKVVNTTLHEERTELKINGVNLKSEVEWIRLAGPPEARNTFENPLAVIPETGQTSFPMGSAMIYTFPPNSVTILKLTVN